MTAQGPDDLQRRATRSGAQGYRADTDDWLNDIEHDEQRIDPNREIGSTRRGGGSPMMMPPMMGGMGGGAGGAAGMSGLGGGAGAMNAARMGSGSGSFGGGVVPAGGAPTAPPTTGPGFGAAGGPGAPGAGGGAGVGAGTLAAGSGAAGRGIDIDGDGIPDVFPGGGIDTDGDGIPDWFPSTGGGTTPAGGYRPGWIDTDGDGIPDRPGASGGTGGYIKSNPDDIDHSGKGWAGIADRMGALQLNASQRQVGGHDFGLVTNPQEEYNTMSTSIQSWSTGASKEFSVMSDKLVAGARAYRETEASHIADADTINQE